MTITTTLNDLVCGLLSRGMTTRDICSQLYDTYDVEISASQVSAISDAILPELDERRNRALDSIRNVEEFEATGRHSCVDGSTGFNASRHYSLTAARPCRHAVGNRWFVDGTLQLTVHSSTQRSHRATNLMK